MASPYIEVICCVNKSYIPNKQLFEDVQETYQITTIVTSVFSIVGAALTLLPRVGIFQRRNIDGRQSNLIKMLAFADMMACLGIICLMILLLIEDESESKNAGDRTLCMVFTTWILYFYISTYFITLSYALDVYLMLKGVNCLFLPALYSSVCFIFPAILMATGLASFYVPLHQTKDNLTMCDETDLAGLLPLYLATYFPILIVMIANPIIFYFAFKKVNPIIKRTTRGQYTDKERSYEQAVKKKFLIIIAVFFICWWPNVILGAINIYAAANSKKVSSTLIITPSDEPEKVGIKAIVVVLWFSMGILNPLQAFLNTLVYVGWGGCCNIAWPSWSTWSRNRHESFLDSEKHDNSRHSLRVNERTTLLT